MFMLGKHLRVLPRRGYANFGSSLSERVENFSALTLPLVHVITGFSRTRLDPRVCDSINSLIANPTVKDFTKAGFFVLDIQRLDDKYRHWQTVLPTVEPHYAVKANPNPAILQHLASRGAGFDCASEAEIEAVLELGVTPDRIIFANPCKPLAHISYARDKGVLKTTFDNLSELEKMRSIFPEAQLVLRIWVDDSGAQCPLSNKYGAESDEWDTLLRKAAEMGLQVHGVSFHVGSGGSAHTYRSALDDAEAAFSLGLSLGHPMQLLDIGGGYPGSDTADTSLLGIADIINSIINDDSKTWRRRRVRIISEPGRYLCSETQALATQVIGMRERSGRRSYYIADSIYQSFNCLLYDHSTFLPETLSPSCTPPLLHHLPYPNHTELSSDVSAMRLPMQQSQAFHSRPIWDMAAAGFLPCEVFGQTCDGLDTIAREMWLPSHLKVGDWLVVANMGAYTNGASSRFNGFPLLDVAVLSSDSPATFSPQTATATRESNL